MQFICYSPLFAIYIYPGFVRVIGAKLEQLLGIFEQCIFPRHFELLLLNLKILKIIAYSLIQSDFYNSNQLPNFYILLSQIVYNKFQLPMEQENKKAADNALFKKLQQIAIKMPSDPILYKQDVQKYKELFKIQFQKIQGETMKKNQRFGELLIFLAKSVKFFPQQLGFIPTSTMSLMNQLGKSLHPYNRKKCISAVMILRAKNILYPISTIQFLLKQFNIEDKQLRKILYKYILNDIRRMNRHHKNNQINQQLKKFISQYITKYSDKTAQKSLQLMIDLYKRNIWTDNRTVNIIADGCFNASTKIRLIASYFLVTTTQPLQQIQESDSENQCVDPSEIKWRKGVRRHTKNKQKKLQKQKRRAQRRLRKKQIAGRIQRFMPIDLIYSPQDFAEKLFNIMNHKNTKFSHKLIYMGLISRIIWRHKLIMLPFYGALQKYMDSRQKQAPKILAYFAESVHDLVPQDQIEPIVKHIIQTFVNDKCSQFAMTIGLNTIRQIYSKFCSIITEEAMTYLCSYYEYKNKNVSTAAKSVINLVRQINPYLLQKKFRGKFANSQPVDIMKEVINSRIKGAQLLGQDNGSIPIEMDKILTDQDFKKIRRLIRKRQQEQEWGQQQQQNQENGQQLQIKSDEFVEVNQDEGQDQEESQLSSQGQQEQIDDQDMEQIDWDDAQQVEEEQEQGEQQEQEGDQKEDDQQQEEIDSEDQDQNNQDQSVLEFDSQDIQEEYDQDQQEQQEQQKTKPKKTKPISKKDKEDKNNKEKQSNKDKNINKKQDSKKTANNKNKSKKNQQASSDDDSYESEQDQNPHGFIDLNRIAFYKRSKTQIKAERRRNPQAKQKFKHKPKQKKGGSTNEQKQRLKPIMMIRAKKNKIKSRQKQLKIRIKSLKTQLGNVRSGKQAKRLKNKKIKKA